MYMGEQVNKETLKRGKSKISAADVLSFLQTEFSQGNLADEF